MRPKTFFAAFLGVLVASLMCLPQLRADEWNRKTIVTFSAPVEVPGRESPLVLPAGKYVFKILDMQISRNVVQILNERENHVYATILAIPNYRLKPADESVISFEERPVGSPQALKAWFYPGAKFGQQFVYPKRRAIELAKEVKEPVLETPTIVTNNEVTEFKTVPVEAVEPTGQVVEMTKVVEPPPATPVQVAEAKPPVKVPRTASFMPLLGLVGFLALGAGFAFRAIRRII